ncbi:response regulator receiver protein [Chthoniobacter flavus Ellin428]|uniref:Response regulator receiver protein n=1 Tax=Chthoniobacter flavus Ellin428 TaxID=497964 RepID=B4CY75_9BACT|nr:response regulator [Chthoniobacter flavus]EDY21223.1 response regulator receiver protein [Chthoniobacter flavus Ellin428]TCO87592.1 response regulator receiver domain-containing protein [Chthoniobacter flavus]
MSKRILVVDDEPNVRLSYRVTLETEGLAVREADCAARALDRLAGEHFDLAILDMRMPEMDGLDLLAEMRKRGFKTPAVIITAYGDIPHAVRAMQLGAIDFLQKPLTPEALRNLVAEILSRHVVEGDPNHSPNTSRKVNVMPDILCTVATVGFFALMIVFMWACEKI